MARRIGIALIVLGLLPYLVMQCWVLSQQTVWRPFDIPVELSQGVKVIPKFTTKASINYRVMLEFKRNLPFQRMECLLGMEWLHPEIACRDIPEVLNVTWQLNSTEGKFIASGNSHDFERSGDYGEKIGRQIGAFKGSAGRQGILQLSVNGDASELDAASPTLVVEAYPGEWEGAVILLQLSVFWAAALGGAGLLTLLFTWISRRFQRPGSTSRILSS